MHWLTDLLTEQRDLSWEYRKKQFKFTGVPYAKNLEFDPRLKFLKSLKNIFFKDLELNNNLANRTNCNLTRSNEEEGSESGSEFKENASVQQASYP